jgi:hypothetical protein
MMRPAAALWFPPCRAEAIAPPALNADAIRLFCLPHAGAGASAYRDWPLLLAPGIEVVPVQLPVGFQNSATALDLALYAARSYSLMRPPRTGHRLIRAWERSGTG